jgi:RNA polymerase sigma factor (sigma-70 family)
MVTQASVVHLVDDDDSLRTALTRVLRVAGHEVRSHASVADFLLARDGALRGCLLLDVRMPGGPSGLELKKALVRQGETLPIIFLTGHGDISMGVRAMKEGAFDFLTKPIARGSLLQAVSAALARDEAVLQASARQRELAARAGRLSPKEREIFHRVVEGQPNKQIAAELGCSERTVKTHRARVMSKMGATSLPDLVHRSEMLQQTTD